MDFRAVEVVSSLLFEHNIKLFQAGVDASDRKSLIHAISAINPRLEKNLVFLSGSDESRGRVKTSQSFAL